MKTRYQVKDGDKWITCTKAAPQKPGWLHYELADGTNGLTYGEGTKWRVKPLKQLGEKQ